MARAGVRLHGESLFLRRLGPQATRTRLRRHASGTPIASSLKKSVPARLCTCGRPEIVWSSKRSAAVRPGRC